MSGGNQGGHWYGTAGAKDSWCYCRVWGSSGRKTWCKDSSARDGSCKECEGLQLLAVIVTSSVGTLKNGNLHKVPLPQVPRDQSTIPVTWTATYTANPKATGYLPDPRIPLYNNLKRLVLDMSKLALAPLSLCRLM